MELTAKLNREILDMERKEGNGYKRWLASQCEKEGHNYVTRIGYGDIVFAECIECGARLVNKGNIKVREVDKQHN